MKIALANAKLSYHINLNRLDLSHFRPDVRFLYFKLLERNGNRGLLPLYSLDWIGFTAGHYMYGLHHL